MKTAFMLVLGIAITIGVFSQTVPPPIHTIAQLSLGGSVQLTWDQGPINGLAEDFEDGIAQDFIWRTPSQDAVPVYPYFVIENGYAEMLTDNENSYWASGVSTLIEYTDFTCEVLIFNHTGNNSRGVLFRGDGHKVWSYNGYSFLFGYSFAAPSHYAVYTYNNGSPGAIIPYTYSDAINTDPQGSNILKVVGQGNTFDFYINGIYVDTATNPNYSSGYVGFTQGNWVTARYEYINCSNNALLMPRDVEPQHGERVEVQLDETGQPTDNPPPFVGSEQFVETRNTRYRDVAGWPGSSDPDFTTRQNQETRLETTSSRATIDELDEFVEYRIYRDGEFIGSSDTTYFIDQLQAYGEYIYRVTAYYEPEGESIVSVPDTTNWQPVTYVLTGHNTVLPATGGTVYYDAQLFNELGYNFAGVWYRVWIIGPEIWMLGPVINYNFTLAPFQSMAFQDLTLDVPANAPPGDYRFIGKLFYQNQPVAEQSFDFDKMGP